MISIQYKSLTLAMIACFVMRISGAQNVLKNPGFEEQDGWGVWGSEQREEPHSGNSRNWKGKTDGLPFIKVKINNSWASVIVISKDGKPLNETSDFYLVTTTPSKCPIRSQ